MYDNVLIAIPSRARFDRIRAYTAGWLLPSDFRWKVFVEPHEAPLYARAVLRSHVVVIPKSNQGMHLVMNCIGEYARQKGYEYIMKIDDDCRGFCIYPDKGSSAANLAQIFDWCLPSFAADSKLGGIRFIQKRFWLYRKKETKLYSHRNKPLWGISLYRASAWPVLPDAVNHFDDTIHSLLMWRDGWDTLTCCRAGVDVLQNSGKGGHRSFDRNKMATESIQYVIDHLFPRCGFKKNTNPEIGVDIDISAYDKGFCL